MISSPRAAHALPYKPAPPSVAWRGRFDRSTKYFLPIHADTGFVDGYSVRRIWQIEAIISGAPEYRLIRALSNESDAFGGPAAIPITPDLISAHPIKSILMIGERRAGKDKREATIRVWDVRDHAIDHRVSPRDKTAVGSGRRADRRKERPARNSLGLLLRRTPMRKSRTPGNAQSPRVSESLHTTGVVI